MNPPKSMRMLLGGLVVLAQAFLLITIAKSL